MLQNTSSVATVGLRILEGHCRIDRPLRSATHIHCPAVIN